MQDEKTLSTNKIIVLLVFICAAIMASVIVYHQSQQQARQTASDNSIIFPVSRDLKDFSLVSSNGKAFTQTELLHHWTLLYFGFTHCPDVCPTTSSLMSKVYNQLHETYPDLQIVLVSLDPQRDSVDALAKYTASFNPAIIGVSGKIQELRKLQSQLGIYSARKDVPGDKDNYRLEHTASIMLINPQGQWAGMFKFGMNPTDFAAELKTSINQLTKVS
jgi:protein SCO1